MLKPARKIYEWAGKKAQSSYSPLWLGVVFVLELVFFVPLDAVLVLFCMENPNKRYLYAAMATVSSVISASVGYFLGYLLWDAIGPFVLHHLISPQFFKQLVHHYNLYQNWAVLIGSFLPIPFKAVTLSAGVCQVTFIPFIICVAIARAARFFLIAQLMQLWGDKMKRFVDRHFNGILMALGAKVLLTFSFFWVLGH